jgi:purine-cytosine permease-like protein
MQSHTEQEGDRLGRIEQAGVGFIPEADRDSTPGNLSAVFIGANLAFAIVVFGWLPITYGLGWWATVSATVVGLAVGTLAIVPIALIGPRTGTNVTVSSGAHFGIRGRFIGSALTLCFALAFAAIAVWTSGDALVAAAHRLVGTPEGDSALAVGYGLISVEIIVVALFGHGTIVALQKVVIPVVGALMLLGVFAYSGHFDAGYAGGEYVLGGFWQTWALAAVVSAAGPLSYAANIGDYTRRISHRRYRDRSVSVAVGGGIFLGLLIPALFGAFTAVTFLDPTDSYVHDLVVTAPGWYVLPIVVIALAGGLGQGVMNVYASGLDLEALVPRLSRLHTTLITSAIAIALLYVGVFVIDAVDSITAMTLILNGVAAPWVAVLVIGAIRGRRTGYDPHDLQAFADGRRGGRYWFTGGWNVPAVVAWSAGSVFGVLAVNTTMYVGPFANLAGGVDLSLVGPAVIATAIYLAGLRLVPEHPGATEIERASDVAPALAPAAAEGAAL